MVTAPGAWVSFPGLSNDKVLQKIFAQQRQPILWQHAALSPLLDQSLLRAAARNGPVVVEVVLAHVASDSRPAQYFIQYLRQPIWTQGLDIEGSLVTGDLEIRADLLMLIFVAETLDVDPNLALMAVPLANLVGGIGLFTNRAY